MPPWCAPTSRWSSSGNLSPCEKHAVEKTNANSIFIKESRNGKTIRCGSVIIYFNTFDYKSTCGFCGYKYRPTLRVALIGISLPAASCFLGRHFLLRENRMMTRKRTPAYWCMSRTMTQSAPIFTWGPCKIVRPCRERRTHRSGEGCPKQSAGSARQERRLRSMQKRGCPC